MRGNSPHRAKEVFSGQVAKWFGQPPYFFTYS